MLTKEQLIERAERMSIEVQHHWREWQDSSAYPDPFTEYLVAALERVQCETAERALAVILAAPVIWGSNGTLDDDARGTLRAAANAIRRAFGLADEPEEEPRG